MLYVYPATSSPSVIVYIIFSTFLSSCSLRAFFNFNFVKIGQIFWVNVKIF